MQPGSALVGATWGVSIAINSSRASGLATTMPIMVQWLMSRPPSEVQSFARRAQRDRQNDDDAPSDQLFAVFQPHQQQAIMDEPDHQRADDRTDNGAGAAEQAGAAKNRRGDHGKLVPFAKLEAPRMKASGVEHSGKTRRHARNHKYTHLNRGGVDAAITRRRLASAGREHAPPERGFAKNDMAGDGDDDHPDEQDGKMKEVFAAENRDIIVVEDRHRLRLRRPHCDAARNAHHRQSRKERRDPDTRGQGSVDDADHKTGRQASQDAGG